MLKINDKMKEVLTNFTISKIGVKGEVYALQRKGTSRGKLKQYIIVIL